MRLYFVFLICIFYIAIFQCLLVIVTYYSMFVTIFLLDVGYIWQSELGSTSLQLTKSVTHTPTNHNIFNTKNYSLVDLHQSKILKNIIKDSNLIKSRRQTPNLKTLLTKQSLHQQKKYLRIYRCGTYAYIQTGQTIRFKKRDDF